jgi:hypothetical protein
MASSIICESTEEKYDSFNDVKFLQSSSNNIIPHLSYIAVKVNYFNEMIVNVDGVLDFKTIESSDKAFRCNIILTQASEKNKVDMIMTFRGTEAWRIQNLIADLSMNFINLDNECIGCLVHDGFLNSFKILEKDIYNMLKYMTYKLSNEGVTIGTLYFTGHSLGGAMANIAAYDFSIRRNSKDKEFKYLREIQTISLITFGAPKVGNKEFAEFMNANNILTDNIRVVYGIDVVVTIPNENPFLKYQTSGDLIYYKQQLFDQPDVVVGYNRGNKKIQPGNTDINYLDKIFGKIENIIQFYNHCLDHLRYYSITRTSLDDSIKKLRKMV